MGLEGHPGNGHILKKIHKLPLKPHDTNFIKPRLFTIFNPAIEFEFNAGIRIQWPDLKILFSQWRNFMFTKL